MSTLRCFKIIRSLPLVAAAVVLCAGGCKKSQAPEEIAVSPVGNPPPISGGAIGIPGAPATAGGSSAPAGNASDWRKPQPKDGPKKASVGTDVAKGESKGVAADDAAMKRRKANEARQRAIDGALAGASGAMTQCFRLAPTRSATATIRFRAHRSGYVLSPTVSGVEPKVASCVRGVLSKLRISGPQGETISVQRTLRMQPNAR